jgi:hypothetical protein
MLVVPAAVVLGAAVVVGAPVVVGAAVELAGEDAAWAGTITDLTTGLTHLGGKPSAPKVPPANATRKIPRRSTLMLLFPRTFTHPRFTHPRLIIPTPRLRRRRYSQALC